MIFGLGGLGSALASAPIFMLPFLYGGRHLLVETFVLPGIMFLAALAGCLALYQDEIWPKIEIAPQRSVAAALLVGGHALFSFYAALLTGLVTALLGIVPPTRPLLFSALPVVIALIFGGCAAATLLAFALYAFTGDWDDRAWAALLLSSLVTVVSMLAINPQFLLQLQRPSGRESDTTFGPAFATLIISSYTLYGASVGYGLARAARRCAVSNAC